MKLEEKIKKCREKIATLREEEAYPSTSQEILERDPRVIFPESEKLKRILQRAFFYLNVDIDKRKAHRLLDKILNA